MAGVLAAFAQFDNDVRPDRTRAGMKAPSNGTAGAKSLMHHPERGPLVRRRDDGHLICRRWRIANALPDPGFRYFSKATDLPDFVGPIAIGERRRADRLAILRSF